MDKIEKISSKIEALLNDWKYGNSIEAKYRCEVYKELLEDIDLLQEEPVSDTQPSVIFYGLTGSVGNTKNEPVSERFTFKAIPRLLEMIEPTDRAKVYIAKLADTLDVEGYSTDAKIVRESLKIMNGEKVAMATMDDEPVSEKLEEAAKYFIPDESYHMIIESKEEGSGENVYDYVQMIEMFKAGAEWQEKKDQETIELAEDHAMLAGMEKMREEMMAKAIRGKVSVNVKSNYHSLIYGCWDMNNALKNCNEGDKVKVIVIKGD